MTTRTDLALLLIRLMTGTTLAFHGAQKLFGAFGGYGIEGSAGYMESLGIPFPTASVVLAGSAEFLGGLAFLTGLFTRTLAAPVAFTMLVAAFTAHSGFDVTQGGMEYPPCLRPSAPPSASPVRGDSAWAPAVSTCPSSARAPPEQGAAAEAGCPSGGARAGRSPRQWLLRDRRQTTNPRRGRRGRPPPRSPDSAKACPPRPQSAQRRALARRAAGARGRSR